MKQPSPETLHLLLEYEVGGGKSYYDRFLTHPTWPGAESGLTVGFGIDCGYYPGVEIQEMFSFLPPNQVEALRNASGKTGQAGKEYVKQVTPLNITIPWEKAERIFERFTWPKYANLAERTFPGLDQLCDNAYGAIVSLVFNRGTSLAGSRRSEMRSIRGLVPQKDYRGIAEELRSMKRIWEGAGVDGLIARREAEARLVESCIS